MKKKFFKKMIDYFNENLGPSRKEKERTVFLKQLKELNYFNLEFVDDYEDFLKLKKLFENDKDFILDFLKNNKTYVEFGEEDFTGDRDTNIHEVVMLDKISPELRNDKDIVFNAIKADYRNIAYASDELKNDKNFILKAINVIDSYHVFSIKYIENNYIENSNREKIIFLSCLSQKLRDDKDVVLAITKKEPKNLIYASERLKDDKRIIMTTVKQDGKFLQYASDKLKNDKDVVMQAIKDDGEILQYASDKLKNDKEVVKEAIRNTSLAFAYASPELKDNKEIFKYAFKQPLYGPFSLANASERLKDDKKLVLKVVKINPLMLEIVSERLKNDKEVVLEAVKSYGHALEYASDKLKDDYDVVMEAVKNKGEALEWASDRLKSDKEIVLEAVKNNEEALGYVGDEIKEKYFSSVQNKTENKKIEQWNKFDLEKSPWDKSNSIDNEDVDNPWAEKLQSDKDNDLER